MVYEQRRGGKGENLKTWISCDDTKWNDEIRVYWVFFHDGVENQKRLRLSMSLSHKEEDGEKDNQFHLLYFLSLGNIDFNNGKSSTNERFKSTIDRLENERWCNVGLLDDVELNNQSIQVGGGGVEESSDVVLRRLGLSV